MKSKKYRDAARDQDCTLQIAGVCKHPQTDTTVLAHFPDESHGTGFKSVDISSGDACSACHDAIDGRVKCQEYLDNRDFYLRRSQTRTIIRRIEQGILVLV